tara:strand:- start:1 stop:180 length:180 start_codon:yes stop_codon:yes gene_type:complete
LASASTDWRRVFLLAGYAGGFVGPFQSTGKQKGHIAKDVPLLFAGFTSGTGAVYMRDQG